MHDTRGVGLGTVTPFTKDNKVDVEGIRKNLGFYLKNGVNSVEPCATTGEGSLLTLEEHEKVIRTTVEFVNHRVPVMPGASGTSPDAIIKLVRLAKDLGADGSYLSTPSYTKPSQEGLLAHFNKIMDSVDVPIVIYNAIHRSGVDLSAEVVQKLSNEFSHFVGFKEQSLARVLKIKGLVGDELALITEDWLFLPGLSLGCVGVQTIAGSIFPAMMVDIYQSYLRGDLKRAREIQIRLYPLMEILGIGTGGREANPTPIKAAMNMLGLEAGSPRLPLLPASEETRSELRTQILKILPSMKLEGV